ncbi:hypothetical protein B0H12DRAFT_1094603 [Mycena haematopus]|nr:hypothetical protein B0H12DRAFT_1094603 [Mycena haematopus]
MNAPQATISALPIELLGAVLTECAAVYPTAPTVLGAVSRLFRHVTYTTPSVWSQLRIAGDTDERKAALWLRLSKAHHVDVEIDLTHSDARLGRAPTTEKIPAAVEALRAHTSRIASLSLRADRQAQAHAALAAIYSDHDTTKALRSLRICATAAAPLGVPLVALRAPTSIVELETTNIPLGALVSLDLRNVQRLRVVQPLLSPPMDTDAIVQLVRGVPDLRRLHVDGRIADSNGGEEECFLGQLESLHVRANNVVTLLDRFVLPQLQMLHISDLDGRRAHASGETASALQRLLVRMRLGKEEVNNNSLRLLELAGVDVDPSTAVWKWCTQRIKLVVFPVQEDVQEYPSLGPAPQEPRTRHTKPAFGFGFGF